MFLNRLESRFSAQEDIPKKMNQSENHKKLQGDSHNEPATERAWFVEEESAQREETEVTCRKSIHENQSGEKRNEESLRR